MKKLLLILFAVTLWSAFLFADNIIPVRTDVSGFSTWADIDVAGTEYLQLLNSTSSTISPAMNFDNFTAETLNFKARTFGGVNAVENEITVSISTDNGSNWSVLGTRLPANKNLTAMTPFDLSSYNGTQVKIKFTMAGTINDIGAGIDDITIAGTPAGAAISVNPISLAGFTYVHQSGPSQELSFALTGSNLTADLAVSVTANYAISSTSGGTFGSSLSFTPASGAVSATIYVRQIAGLDVGSYTGTITCSSTGATNKTVSLSGTVTAIPLVGATETFDNFSAAGSYSSGNFLGQDGSTWTYVNCRGDYSITGSAPMLRDNDTAHMTSGTISGGIGEIEFKYMQAFTTNVSLNLYINNVVVATVTSSSQQGVVLNSGRVTVNQAGNFTIKFARASGGGQVVIDDVTWSSYGDPPAATPLITPPAGTYFDSQTVSISCETAGASVYYTENGDTPTDLSTLYTGSFLLSSSATIKAIAYASGYSPSQIASSVYTIIQEPSNHVTSFEGITGYPGNSQIYLSWTDSTGEVLPDAYLIKGSVSGFSAIVDPVDGVFEANSGLVQNVAYGVNEFTFNSLTENTNYYFKIYPYCGSGDIVQYKTDGIVPSESVLTEYGPPTIPAAISATAVSHEGFTARWDTVVGAESYRIDVLRSQLTPFTINEGFNSGTTAPAGWTFTAIGGTYTTATNFGFSSPSLQFDNTGDRVLTPVFQGATAVSYWLKGQSTNAVSALTVEQFDGDNWTVLATIQPIPTTGTINTHELTSNITQVRFTYTKSFGNLSFDDVTINGSTYAMQAITGWDNLTVATSPVRVSGLDAATDYQYVVRAFNENGTSANSNAVNVSTTATVPGAGAGTLIGDDVDIIVPPVGILTDNSVTIDPASGTDIDFNVTVSVNGQTLIYTISSSNTDALNGLYLLNHAGPTNAPTGYNVSTGTLVDSGLEAGVSYFEISGIAAKGELVISLEFDQTLPVELSSFTYTLNPQNLVTLHWITQTETNVLGYYIYRGKSEEASEAVLVSDMIAATNTSTLQSYIFVDSELQEQGTYYYWLQNLDMDGSNAFHGPVRVEYNFTDPGTPNQPLVTALNRVYPNPFNPTTFINYSLSENSPVQFKIYNNRGQLVRTITNAPTTAGNHRVDWNGTDENGSACSTGLYLIRMEAGKESFTRKVVLVK